MAPYGRQPLFSFFFVRRETRTEFFGKRRRRRRSSGRVHWTLPPDGAHCADRSMERHAPTGAKRTAALDDDASSSTPTPAKNPVKLGKTADGWNARSLSVVVGLLFFRNSYTHTHRATVKNGHRKKEPGGWGLRAPLDSDRGENQSWGWVDQYAVADKRRASIKRRRRRSMASGRRRLSPSPTHSMGSPSDSALPGFYRVLIQR